MDNNHFGIEIKVDWYDLKGKWKYGGIVNIGNARLYKGNIPKAIIKNQKIINKGWEKSKQYIVVINDTEENWNNENYLLFNKAVFFPNRFIDCNNNEEVEQ